MSLRVEEGAPGALAEALVALSRLLYMTADLPGARAAADRAVGLLGPDAPLRHRAAARTQRGVLMLLDDAWEESLIELAAAHRLAEGAGAQDLVALCLNYCGVARAYLGDADGVAMVRRGVTAATATGHHEYEVRGYTGLVRSLRALGRWDEIPAVLEQGLERTRRADLRSHAYYLTGFRHQAQIMRGNWDRAEAGLRELVATVPDAGILGREALPVLARLLARRGRPDAGEWLDRSWEMARRADVLGYLMPTCLAVVEAAWLDGEPARAAEAAEVLLARTDRPGAERVRGELLRYLRRLGLPAEPFPGCPEEFAAGLRGEPAVAAAPGSASAPPTNAPSNWRRPTMSTRCLRRSPSWTDSARNPPHGSPAEHCAGSASSGCPVARGRARGRTRPG